MPEWIQYLAELDRDLFLFLNDIRADWLDRPMYILTKGWAWAWIYVIIIYFLVKYYDWKTAIAAVLGVSLVITFADRGSVELFKEVFQRLRPSRNPLLEGQVELVTNFKGEIYRGGKYGFVSSHASNYFGLATYFSLILGKFNRKWWFWMMLWALVVSYTRIYLGVHYPGDIFGGALFGMLCGLVAFLIVRFIVSKIPNLKSL